MPDLGGRLLTRLPTVGSPPSSLPAAAIPTLRSRLILLAATVALPLLVLATAAIWHDQDSARQRAEYQILMQAGALALAVDREFAAAVATIRTLANSRALARVDLVEFQAEMQAAATQTPGAAIGLAGADGTQTLLTTTPGGRVVHPGMPANEAAQRALATGATAISDLYREPVSGLMQIAIATPAPAAIDDPAGIARVISIAIFADGFDTLMAGRGLPAGWVAVLTDRQVRIVSRSERAAEFVGQVGPPNVVAAIGSADAGVVRLRRLDGIAAVAAFAHAPTSGFAVSVAVPEATFAAPLYRALLQFVGIGLLLTLGGLGLAAVLGARIVAAIDALSTPGAGTRRGQHYREVDAIARRLDAAERWQGVLMAEMNHRVKNTLLTVQALAAQTMKGAKDDPARFQREFGARLATLARAHDLLIATGWESADIDTVLTAALAPWLTAPVRQIRISHGPGFMVVPRQAQALVLGLHELATNAVKYGAMSRPGGQVLLHAMLAADGRALLTWTEVGGPPIVGPPERQSFGTRLLRRALPHDLGPGATVEMDYAPAGLQVRIGFIPGTAGPPLLPPRP